jgi:hypothetical protein
LRDAIRIDASSLQRPGAIDVAKPGTRWQPRLDAAPRRLHWFVVAALLTLAACATTDKAARGDKPGPATADALNDPMSDFRFAQGKLPPVLVAAMTSPYARPVPGDCAALAAEVAALDHALGADLDVRVGKPGSDVALRALASGIKSLIPYFGWIRRLSGADRRERLALAAHEAGSVRRAYLKGLGESRGCKPPAVPVHRAPEPPVEQTPRP